MEHHHMLPRHGLSHTATGVVLGHDLLDGSRGDRPASPASLVPMPFSPCLPPVEDDLLLHGPAASAELPATTAPHHHFLVPSPFAAPLSPLSQNMDEEPHAPPQDYLPCDHPPVNAATRKKILKSSRLRRAKALERRALETQLEELTREVDKLTSEKLKLQEVTRLLEQDLSGLDASAYR